MKLAQTVVKTQQAHT